MKNLRKMTMLLFVAATMFIFSSCNKDDDDNGSSSGGSTPTLEEQIIGKWAVPQNVGDNNGGVMEIYADHKMKIVSTTLDWTLNGRELHAIYDAYNQIVDIEVTIGDINETTMTLTGTYKYYRAGNLFKEFDMGGVYVRMQ